MKYIPLYEMANAPNNEFDIHNEIPGIDNIKAWSSPGIERRAEFLGHDPATYDRLIHENGHVEDIDEVDRDKDGRFYCENRYEDDDPDMAEVAYGILNETLMFDVSDRRAPDFPIDPIPEIEFREGEPIHEITITAGNTSSDDQRVSMRTVRRIADETLEKLEAGIDGNAIRTVPKKHKR